MSILSAAVAVAAALLVPGAASSKGAQNELVGTVGPGFTIRLQQNGSSVTHLDPGTYTITVNDLSTEHNFDLRGPGVDMHTEVETTGTFTWTVTFTDGRYTYQCDPHALQLRGTFTVGNPPPPPPPPAPAGKAKKLTGTVGPGFSIKLAAGSARVKTLKAGLYRITVRDRSASHNFHLIGPGAGKATGVRFRGTKTWTVRLRKGKTYRYRCDPHRATMRGSFRVK